MLQTNKTLTKWKAKQNNLNENIVPTIKNSYSLTIKNSYKIIWTKYNVYENQFYFYSTSKWHVIFLELVNIAKKLKATH